jgi:hypothetical protein
MAGAETPAPVSDYDTLLAGYLASDAGSLRLELEKEKALLEMERYSRETGTAVTVSSGDTVLAFSPGGLAVSAKPVLELGLPGFRKAGLSLAVPLQSRGAELTGAGVDLSLTALLAGGQSDSRQAETEERKRRVVTALRNLENGRLTAEEEFCRRIRDLFLRRNAMLEARRNLLDAGYDLELKRAGGYDSSGVVLRTAELRRRTRERELREAERALDAALGEFAESCGAGQAGTPENIPDEALLSAAAFDPLGFKELEAAVWTHRQNSLTRQAQDRPFSLEGRAGYSWRMDSPQGSPQGSLPRAGSSVNAGAGLSTGEISASAGVSVPLDRPGEPSLNLSLRWKPGGAKTAALDRRIRVLESRQEARAIGAAERKYRDFLKEYDRKKADLEWQRESYDEEAELYRINMEEQARWLNLGVIRERDYADARTNYLLAENRALAARVDRRLYNLEIRARFIPEE